MWKVYILLIRDRSKCKKVEEITYDEMLILLRLEQSASYRSVEMAKKYNVQLVVRSSLTEAEGTIVKEVVKVEKRLVSGVAADKNAARISLIGLKDVPGIAFKLFNLLAKENINVDIILQSVGRDGTKDISFTVDNNNLKSSLEVIEKNKDALTAQRVESEENVAKISVVGAGMMTDPGVAAKMFEALFNEDINIKMISTSEIRVLF
jgi:aspartate kinase